MHYLYGSGYRSAFYTLLFHAYVAIVGECRYKKRLSRSKKLGA